MASYKPPFVIYFTLGDKNGDVRAVEDGIVMTMQGSTSMNAVVASKSASLLAVLPLMAALLAACNPTYVQPTTGEVAKVTFVNGTRGDFLLHSYKGVERCTEPEGIGTLASGSALTISVDARKAATLSAQYLRGTGGLSVEYCIFAGSFRPTAGHSYRLAITLRDGSCFLSFMDQTAPASAQPDRTFAIRKYSTPLVASAGFCSPLSEPEKRDLKLSEP